jgi:small-conductance mechanosensitive channel
MRTAEMFDFLTRLKAGLAALAVNAGMALLVFAGFWVVARLVFAVVAKFARRAGAEREAIVMLVAQMARIVLLVFGVITALGTAGIDVSALVAGLGLTGFALGFAFRDALSNVLAGFMILFYRPFRRGDRITVTSLEGVVSEINLRYTVIEAEKARVLIPNANMLTNPIVVHADPEGGKRGGA